MSGIHLRVNYGCPFSRALMAEPSDADKPKIGYLTEGGRE